MGQDNVMWLKAMSTCCLGHSLMTKATVETAVVVSAIAIDTNAMALSHIFPLCWALCTQMFIGVNITSNNVKSSLIVTR